MKIAFDGRYAEGNLVGIGNYIKNLILNLDKLGIDCVIIYSKKPRDSINGKNTTQVILKPINSYHYEQILLPYILTKERVDIYHAVGNMGIPLFCPVPSVLTVHDLIPLEYKNYFSNSDFPFLSKMSYFLKLKSSIQKASRIIAVSNYVKKELISKMHVKSESVIRIYSGVAFKHKKVKLITRLQGKRYILYHGGLDIRKNVKSLIEAFSIVNKKDNSLFLVITGENKLVKNELDNNIKKLGLEKKVIFTGFLNLDSLYQVIVSSKIICYPSLSEGFGFPILEGFAAGIPVITSNVTAIPEIANGAAMLINPNNVNEIADAITKVTKDAKLAKSMVIKGLKEYSKYDWAKVANEYLDLYNSI